MLRLIALLLSVAVSIGLVYVFGFWVLLGLFAVAMATVLCSTVDVGDDEPTGDTGYGASTMAARL
jgi:hypothetical protein